jgi:hypothetical protein
MNIFLCYFFIFSCALVANSLLNFKIFLFLKQHTVKENSNKHILIYEVNYKITINKALIYETFFLKTLMINVDTCFVVII